MESSIVLYASAEHLNSMLVLATFISKHHPSRPITIISTADDSVAAAVSAVASITYRRLPPPPNYSFENPVEAFFEIPRLLNPSLRAALEEMSPIGAFVIDFFCNSAYQVSTSLNIPTFFYVSTGTLGVSVLLYFPDVAESVGGDIIDLHDYLEFPGSPMIHSSDLPDTMFFRGSNVYKHVLDTANNMRKSSGILSNGFDAIELRAKEAVTNGLCFPGGVTPPVYLVGPLIGESSRTASTLQQEVIGGSCSGEREHECLRWLDRQPARSVVFLCFGRRGLQSAAQVRETAVALERSGQRFLWSVRNPPGVDLPEEWFLERTKERGFVVKTWAPQREVLAHEAIGGFVTHCGRSSVLEALANGVPMIGWPMYAEQRLNRVFMVEEMRVALPLNEAEGGFITAAELEARLRELMASRDLRRRLVEIKASAAAALREKNGSSVLALRDFINSLVK